MMSQRSVSHPVAHLLLVAVFAYYSVEPVLTLLWLYQVAEIVWVSKVLNVGILFCLTSVLLRRGRVVIDKLSNWMGLMLFAGASVGFVRGNSGEFALSHLYYISFALVVYTGFRSLPVADLDLRRLLRWSSPLLFLSALGSLLYFSAFMLGKGYYPGLGLATLLIPFSFFLIKRNSVGALLCLFVLLSTGKRGVFIAFLVVVLVYFGMQRVRSFGLLAMLSACFLTAVMAASFWALLQFDASNPTLSKLNLINPLAEDTDFEIGSGGRVTEILRAYEAFSEAKFGWILGAGIGFTYEWWSDTGSWGYEPARHYLHMSYLNYVFQYGGLLTAIFLLFIYRILAAAYAHLRDSPGDIASYVLFLYCIGKLTHAVFGFVLAGDPLLWAALGILARRAVRPRRVPQLISALPAVR